MSNYCPELDFSGRYQAYSLSMAWANHEAWKYERDPAGASPWQGRVWATICLALALTEQRLHRHPTPLPQ